MIFNKIFLTLLSLILLSCSTSIYKGESRSLASKTTINCKEMISHFLTAENAGIYNKYKKFSKYNDPLVFTLAEKKYLNKIDHWAQAGNRKNTLAQMRHNSAFSRVKTAFEIDSVFGIVRQFTSLFAEVESSFFIATKAFKQSQEIEKILKALGEGEVDLDKLLAKASKYLETSLLTRPKLKASQLETRDLSVIKKSLLRDLSSLNEVMIDNIYIIQLRLDEYRSTRLFIEKNPSPKKEEVLKKLNIRNILSSCTLCGDLDGLERPALSQIEELTNNSNVVRIKSLKRDALLERWVTVVSHLPSQYVYQLIDRVIQTVPWLNNSAFRKWLRTSFIDFKDRYNYFPRIDRIIFSKASNEELVKLLNEYQAHSGQEFLVTMARRTDAQNSWKKLYKWLGDNKPADSRDQLNILFKNMDQAWDEAVKRGPMAEWHHPNKTNQTRFILDLMMYGGSAYASYYYISDVVEVFGDVTDFDFNKEQELHDALKTELDKIK